MMLELMYVKHEASFLTLTYADDHCPPGGNVDRDHLYLFLKLLRKKLALDFGKRITYYAVGEYGRKRLRPHYHLCIFGHSFEPGYYDYESLKEGKGILGESWERGAIHVARFTQASGRYATKHLAKVSYERERIEALGLVPEFSSCSRRPALGLRYVRETLGPRYTTNKAAIEEAALNQDVPNTLAIEGLYMPVGRYIRRMLRTECGWDVAQPDLARCMQMILEDKKYDGDIGLAAEHRRQQRQLSADKASIWLTRSYHGDRL